MANTVHWEQNGIYRKFEGKISGDEVLVSNFDLQSDPRFMDIAYIINNFSDVTSHDIQIAHTNVYAKTDDIASNTKGKLKIAIVSPQEDLMELAKHYKKEMEGKLFCCEIFDTLEGAREWVS